MSGTTTPSDVRRADKRRRSSCELKTDLANLELSQADFAQLLDVSSRAVSMWVAGDVALPGPVAGYLRVLRQLAPDDREREFARVDRRRRALEDGFYRVRYSGRVEGALRCGQAYCVFRKGVIFGADVAGSVVEGRYAFDPGLGKTSAQCVVRSADPDGAFESRAEAFAWGPIEISGAFVRPAPHAKAKVNVGNGQVDVVLTLLGPIPE